MLALSFFGGLLSVLLIIVSLLLIALILLQKNRGAGLSGAFGGVGGHSAFGTKTGDFLTWVTVGLVFVFIVLNIFGNFAFEPDRKRPEPAAGLSAPIDATETTDGQNAPSGDEAGADGDATTPAAEQQ